MSLTDRMAAALRSMRDSWDTNAENFVVPAVEAHSLIVKINALLAEHDNPQVTSAKKMPQPWQPWQRVRCRGKPDEPQWRGVVLYTKYDTVAVGTDDGGELISMADELEVILNLPATNTGD